MKRGTNWPQTPYGTTRTGIRRPITSAWIVTTHSLQSVPVQSDQTVAKDGQHLCNDCCLHKRLKALMYLTRKPHCCVFPQTGLRTKLVPHYASMKSLCSTASAKHKNAGISGPIISCLNTGNCYIFCGNKMRKVHLSISLHVQSGRRMVAAGFSSLSRG